MLKSKKLLSLLLVLLLVLSQCFVLAETSQIPTRSESGDDYKWKLSEIYGTEQAYYADATALMDVEIPKLKAFVGKLSTPDEFVKFMALDQSISRKVEKLYVFAYLQLDLDQTDSIAQEMTSKADMISGAYSEASSFFSPELLALDAKSFDALKNAPATAYYKVFLTELQEEKAHILSAEGENILSMLGDITGAPKSIFDKLTVADTKWPDFDMGNGEIVTLDPVTYSTLTENPNRELRKRAFETRSGYYATTINTLAQTYISEINKNIFMAKVRKYPSALEASLAADTVPKAIYDQLVTSVNANLKPLHDYFTVRKHAMGIDKLYAYDAYVPLVDNYTMDIPYNDAVNLIATALEPLGETYVSDFKMGIKNNWVDVYPDENKYGGGYQWGAYDTHPYILMNYDNTLDGALTLAHEMGHALNSYYSNKTQTPDSANYSIFTAEVASTLNELLVMDYLIKNAKNDEEKLFLVNKQIDNVRGTIYSQVMFAEFEQKAHALVESGTPLSAEALNDIWVGLLKTYYGPDYTVLESQANAWSRIPHFYMNFYVYKYATSMSAAYDLLNGMKANPKEAIPKYLEFLSAGGSDLPVNLLKTAGVDMNTKAPVDNTLAYFAGLVKELDTLTKVQPVAVVKKQNTYVIKSGDMLWKIAAQFKTTLKSIIDINTLKNPNKLTPGQTLMIPVQ